MPFDRAALLAPTSEDRPCGEPVDNVAVYDELKSLANAQQRPDWARYLDRAVSLSQVSRDLRAWVWVTRAALCAEGVIGLGAGLQLIAEGLEKYWDSLPPQHLDEVDPRERFMSRLSALTRIGATNFGCSLSQLLTSGRTVTDLRADLDTMVAQAVPDAATRQAVDDARSAIARICEIFAQRFGADRDPQLGFEVLLDKLGAVEKKLTAVGIAGPEGTRSAGKQAVVGNPVPGSINVRDDVVRTLNLVLDYYKSNEPSSPVPLLIQRAKRLVSLSFMDAIKDLAPTGLKELQAVAGTTDEKQ